MQNKKSFGIVGGGILGMTLALRIAQKGHEVTIFEAAKSFGGLASAWDLDDFTWDKYYHVILLSDLKTRALLRELGIEDKMNWVETKTGFYSDGKLHSMSNTVEFLKFPPLNLIDKFRLGGTIFYTSKLKNWKRLEKIPVEKFLKRLSGKNTFNKIWLPLLRAKLGDEYQKTSAAFIWATIQRMYSARKSGLKKEMFGYMEGGYLNILSNFKRKLEEDGVNLKPDSAIKKIEKGKNKNVKVQFNDKSEEFDEVINTLPSSFVSKLIPELSEQELLQHSKISYLGVICPSVVLRKAISPYYVTNITDPGFPFTGIIEMTALVDRKKLNNKHLIYLPKYVRADDDLFNQSEEEVKLFFTTELLKMYPQLSKEDILFTKLAKARQVFALNTLSYSENLPSIKTSIEGLSILNSAHITNGTLNVNETIQLAETSLDLILD